MSAFSIALALFSRESAPRPPMENNSKLCGGMGGCLEVKLLTEFYARLNSHTGHTTYGSICKACQIIKDKARNRKR